MAESFYEYGEIRDGKVIRKPFLDFPEKEVGEAKEDEATTIACYTQRFEEFQKKVLQLEKDIYESANKGSFLMKLLHLKEQLGEQEGVGDYASMHAKLEELEQYLQSTIEENRRKNLEIKTKLLEEAEQLKDSKDWKEATQQFKELKQKWIKTGRVVEDKEEEIEQRFKAAVDHFFTARNKFFEEKKQVIEDRVQEYEKLIEQMEKLAGEVKGTAREKEQLRKLHEDWKSVGKVPHTTMQELWERFKTSSDQVLKTCKSNNGASGGGVKEAIAAKEKIKEEARALLHSDMSPEEQYEQVKGLQQQWKESNSVPYNKIKGVHREFLQICDYIQEKAFLLHLARKKYNGFDQKAVQEQFKIMQQLMKELISKNESDLNTYSENLEKFNVSSDNKNFSKVINSKLENRKRKLEAKKTILSEVKEELSQLVS